jgi:hypothetical protein
MKLTDDRIDVHNLSIVRSLGAQCTKVSFVLQNANSDGIVEQMSFVPLFATCSLQLLLFCWHGGELTYQVTWTVNNSSVVKHFVFIYILCGRIVCTHLTHVAECKIVIFKSQII